MSKYSEAFRSVCPSHDDFESQFNGCVLLKLIICCVSKEFNWTSGYDRCSLNELFL